jgi:hypothetical protein
VSQSGYTITGCTSGTTASGTTCVLSATCATGYTGTATGSVICTNGVYSFATGCTRKYTPRHTNNNKQQ